MGPPDTVFLGTVRWFDERPDRLVTVDVPPEADSWTELGTPFAQIAATQLWVPAQDDDTYQEVSLNLDEYAQRPVRGSQLHWTDPPIDADRSALLVWLTVCHDRTVQVLSPLPVRESGSRERVSVPVRHGDLIGIDVGANIDINRYLKLLPRAADDRNALEEDSA